MMTTIDTATTAQMRPITSSVSILPPLSFTIGPSQGRTENEFELMTVIGHYSTAGSLRFWH
jgi:hypothetical protein